MAFTKQRFLTNNLVNADNITASSQAAGTIQQAKKDGTGTALLNPSGSYTGAGNLLYTVQCDVAGSVDGAATFRWRTSATVTGTWEATGVSATSTTFSLSNGVQGQFTAGTLVLNDLFQFWAYAENGPGKMFTSDRDDFWKSGALPGTLLTNGYFDSATTGWTPQQCTIASIAGGVSGNCCELTYVTGATQWFYQNITTVAGERYHLRGYVKSGTSGNETFRFFTYDLTGAAAITFVEGTTSATWTQYDVAFTAPSTSTRIYCYKMTGTAGTMLFDSVECYKLPSLEIDLGSAQLITAVVLADHNFSSAAIITLAANSSDAWSSPAYSTALLSGANTDPSVDYISQTYRYWKVFLDDPDNTDGFLSIGKLYAGTYTEVYSGELRGGTNWDTPRTRRSIEITNESTAGKETFRVYAEREEFPLVWTWLSLTALATIRTIWESFRTLSTGTKIYQWLHYWTDDESTMFFVTRTNDFSPTYHRGGHELTLEFRENVITREI